jgi:hypothetical protein
MDSKLKQHFCIKVCTKLGKSAAKTFEVLHEAFGQWFLSGIHVLRPVECQLMMRNIQGDQVSAKQQKMLTNRELIHKDCSQIIHELADTVGFSYGVLQAT